MNQSSLTIIHHTFCHHVPTIFPPFSIHFPPFSNIFPWFISAPMVFLRFSQAFPMVFNKTTTQKLPSRAFPRAVAEAGVQTAVVDSRGGNHPIAKGEGQTSCGDPLGRNIWGKWMGKWMGNWMETRSETGWDTLLVHEWPRKKWQLWGIACDVSQDMFLCFHSLMSQVMFATNVSVGESRMGSWDGMSIHSIIDINPVAWSKWTEAVDSVDHFILFINVASIFLSMVSCRFLNIMSFSHHIPPVKGPRQLRKHPRHRPVRWSTCSWAQRNKQRSQCRHSQEHTSNCWPVKNGWKKSQISRGLVKQIWREQVEIHDCSNQNHKPLVNWPKTMKSHRVWENSLFPWPASIALSHHQRLIMVY